MTDANAEASDRARRVTWDDPRSSQRDAARISGLDYLLALLAGTIPQPPAARLIGYSLREVEWGRAVFELEPAEHHYNPFSSVHGGILSTLLDSAMTAAVLSTLAAGETCTTLDLKINFVRPVTLAVGVLHCEGSIVHAGSRFATAHGKLRDGRGRLYAHAVNTCAIFSAQ